MTELIMYLYGMFSGLAIVATLLVAKHLIIKSLTIGWAGSAPTTLNAIKASLDKSERPY